MSFPTIKMPPKKSNKNKTKSATIIPKESINDSIIATLSTIIHKQIHDELNPEYRFINVKLKNPYFVRVNKIYYTDDVENDPRFAKYEMIHTYAIKFLTNMKEPQHNCDLDDMLMSDNESSSGCRCDGSKIYITGVGDTIKDALNSTMKQFYKLAKCCKCKSCYKINDTLFSEKDMKCFSCILNSYCPDENEKNDLCSICQTKNIGIYKSLGCCSSKYHINCLLEMYRENDGPHLKCPTCRKVYLGFYNFINKNLHELECSDDE
jgi:hypothetical protein